MVQPTVMFAGILGRYPCYPWCVSIIRSAEATCTRPTVEIECLLRTERLRLAAN